MAATSPEPGRPDAERKPRRSRLLVAGGVAAVVVVVVVSVVLGTRGDDAGNPADGASSPAFPSDPSGTSTPVTSQEPSEGQTPAATAAPVPLDESAQPIEGVVASIGELSAVDGVADGPGEVAGPAVSFSVSIANETGATVDLSSAVVTVGSGEDDVPADALATGSTPLPAEVEAGGTVTGTYVFTVPVESRDTVRITFDYLTGTPAVVFTGAAPRP